MTGPVVHDGEVQQWVMDRDERRESRHLLALLFLLGLGIYVSTLTLIVYLAVSWGTTGDDRFAWALAITLASEVLGYAYLFRKHPDEVRS